MEHFKDQHGGEVFLSFEQGAFDCEPAHVLVICRFGEEWLLTNHKVRGWEFPGGKKEPGETLEEAAAREVLEETGAIACRLHFIAEYKVISEGASFVKRVFFAEIAELRQREHFYETNGPVMEKGNLEAARFGPHYSFIMKDQVIGLCLDRLKMAGLY